MSREESTGLTARSRQREETRRKVYDAALSVFRRDGVATARIEDIAAMAGVSRGTFYFHFTTREDVLLELLRSTEANLVERIDQLPLDAPISEVLGEVATGMADTWKDDAGLLAEVGMVALRISAQGLPAVGEAHPIRMTLVPRFKSAERRGEIGQLIPPELLADFFLINLFGAALAWCGNQMLGLEDLLKNVVLFFLKSAVP
jgi:AcrR family transcriptional regulator